MTNNKRLKTGRNTTPKGNLELIDAFRELGQSIGHNLYRIIVFDEGCLEVELESQNPWKCLAVRLVIWNLHALAPGRRFCFWMVQSIGVLSIWLWPAG